MEYTVFDLIRILIKKWYVILLAMCALGGASVFTAESSYNQVVRNYEASISETISAGVDTGTLSAAYFYDYELTDLTKYLEDAQRRAAFYARFESELGISSEENLLSVASLAGAAYTSAAQEAAALVTDVQVIERTQTAISAYGYVEPPVLDENEELVVSTDPLNILNHLTIETISQNVIRVTISGLEEAPSRQLLEAYLSSVKSVGLSDYSIEAILREEENTFTLDPLRLSQSAQFAQTVMAVPEKAPVMVRTIGTAAAGGFVFSCFLILAVTFVLDSRKTAQADRSA